LNAVTVFENEDGKKNPCRTKEEERYKIRTHKELQVILQATDIVKFIQSLRIRRYGHDERVDKGRMRNKYLHL